MAGAVRVNLCHSHTLSESGVKQGLWELCVTRVFFADVEDASTVVVWGGRAQRAAGYGELGGGRFPAACLVAEPGVLASVNARDGTAPALW